MIKKLRNDAYEIVKAGIQAVLPDEAVKRALADFEAPRGRLVMVAAGKAAWQMASAAAEALGGFDDGIVITKYGHVMGDIPGVSCFEAGHPVPDENGFEATRNALGLVRGLGADDKVLFLLSGGGSALFELPLVPGEELQDITAQLLQSGADIVEINTIRKRLSAVKGGRFALECAPAEVFTIALSDVIGGRNDMIASGPACPDISTCEEAEAIVKKYGISLSEKAESLLAEDTTKELDNASMYVTGSVSELCRAVAEKCEQLGYRPVILTDRLECEASEAGEFMASVAAENSASGQKAAFIAGGETVVHLKGHGLGGRNQELALAAAQGIRGLDAAVFSFGSDGTDGPTDAAGGYVDGDSYDEMIEAGTDPQASLLDNDSYHALGPVGGLIITGPTGTNVNDVAVAIVNSSVL